MIYVTLRDALFIGLLTDEDAIDHIWNYSSRHVESARANSFNWSRDWCYGAATMEEFDVDAA
jgi:hypothetical protein